jgi:hypothetical protein
MPNNGFVLDGDNPLDQALKALDDRFATRLEDLKEQQERTKNLFSAWSTIGKADAKAAERYDLTVIMALDVYENGRGNAVTDISVSVDHNRCHMDWIRWQHDDSKDDRPTLAPGKYAVVLGLKRIGDE